MKFRINPKNHQFFHFLVFLLLSKKESENHLKNKKQQQKISNDCSKIKLPIKAHIASRFRFNTDKPQFRK